MKTPNSPFIFPGFFSSIFSKEIDLTGILNIKKGVSAALDDIVISVTLLMSWFKIISSHGISKLTFVFIPSGLKRLVSFLGCSFTKTSFMFVFFEIFCTISTSFTLNPSAKKDSSRNRYFILE